MPVKHADFPYALKSFIGYLEGTQKSAHTIKNYRLDLLAFQAFLENLGDKPIALSKLTPNELERFHDHLKGQGLKSNTRRRKLLTVQKFIGYLANRNKLPVDLARKLPTPHKIERVPYTVPYTELLDAIRKLPFDTALDARNRALLWTLAETGCQVSEVVQVRFDHWDAATKTASLKIPGKASRVLPVSMELYRAIQELRAGAKSEWIFLGFNKFGSLGAPISPRGVELLVKMYGGRLGYSELVPRTFRHSAVLYWFSEKHSRKQIQERLGLKTDYAFRVFEPLLKGASAG